MLFISRRYNSFWITIAGWLAFSILLMVGCNGPLDELGSEMHIVRTMGEDRRHGEVLWRKVPVGDFCNAMGCLSMGDPRDREVMEKLNAALSTVVSKLGIQGVPRPELVFLHPDNLQHAHKMLENIAITSELSSSPDSRFYTMNYREVVNVDIELDQGHLEPQRQGYLRITPQGISHFAKYDHNEFAPYRLPEELLADNASIASKHQLVALFQEVFKGSLEFKLVRDRMSEVIKVRDVSLDYVESNSGRSIQIIPARGPLFYWNVYGVVVERRFNKLIYLSSERLYQVPYHELLVELLNGIYTYYEQSFLATAKDSLSSGTSLTPVFKEESRLPSAQGKLQTPVASFTPEEIKLIFRSRPYTGLKADLKISPELWSLLYFLETYSFYMSSLIHSVPQHVQLFYNSNEAESLYNEFKNTVYWHEFKSEIQNMIADATDTRAATNLHGLLQQTGVFLQIISMQYDEIPSFFLNRIEEKLLQFYRGGTRYHEIFQSGTTQVTPEDIVHFFYQSVLSAPLWLNDIGMAALEWLIDGRGQDFSNGMKYFSQLIEDRKGSYNRKQQLMITHKATPYYQDYVRDETLAYYFDLLGEPITIYENYVLRDLSDVEKARCLMSLKYQDDLFEMYQMRLLSAGESLSAFVCGRILNLRKEMQRHY